MSIFEVELGDIPTPIPHTPGTFVWFPSKRTVTVKHIPSGTCLTTKCGLNAAEAIAAAAKNGEEILEVKGATLSTSEKGGLLIVLD